MSQQRQVVNAYWVFWRRLGDDYSSDYFLFCAAFIFLLVVCLFMCVCMHVCWSRILYHGVNNLRCVFVAIASHSPTRLLHCATQSQWSQWVELLIILSHAAAGLSVLEILKRQFCFCHVQQLRRACLYAYVRINCCSCSFAASKANGDVDFLILTSECCIIRGAVRKFPEMWCSTVMIGHMTTLT